MKRRTKQIIFRTFDDFELSNIETRAIMERMPIVFEKIFSELSDRQKKITLESIKNQKLEKILQKWKYMRGF